MGPTLAFIITTVVVVSILFIVIRAADRNHTNRPGPAGSDDSSQ